MWLLRHRLISGRTFSALAFDCTFSSGDVLNAAGHAFAEAYYNNYLTDYEQRFAGRYRTVYHVKYSRRNRQQVAAMLDQKHAAWATAAISPSP